MIPVLLYFNQENHIADISLIYYTASFTSGILLFGMPIYLLSERINEDAFKNAVSDFALFHLTCFFLLLVICYPASIFLSSILNQSTSNLYFGFILGGAMNLNFLSLYKFKTLDQGSNYFIFSFFLFLLTITIGISLSIYFDYSILFYSGYFIYLIYFGFVYYAKIRNSAVSRVALIFKFGYAFIPNTLAGWLLANLDKYVLNLYLDKTELSRYIQISSGLAVLIITIVSLDKIYENRIFELLRNNGNCLKLSKKYLMYFFIITGLCVTGGLMVNSLFFMNIYENQVIIILLCSGFPFAINQIIIKYILYHKKIATISKNAVISAILVTLMVLVLSKKYGALATSWATFIGYTTIAFLNSLYVYREKLYLNTHG